MVQSLALKPLQRAQHCVWIISLLFCSYHYLTDECYFDAHSYRYGNTQNFAQHLEFWFSTEPQATWPRLSNRNQQNGSPTTLECHHVYSFTCYLRLLCLKARLCKCSGDDMTCTVRNACYLALDRGTLLIPALQYLEGPWILLPYS